MEEQLMNVVGSMLTYSYQEVLINIVLAAVLGFVLAVVYRYTHKGLSYSQSFTQTILLVAIIVAIVMMVIGSSLAKAFALVGALSIIRFRTVVKDTRDIAFVFLSLAVGMAAGTSNYFLALVSAGFVSVLALLTYKFNFGALYKSEFILRFTFDQNYDSAVYLEIIQKHGKRSSLLHIEPSGDRRTLRLTYDISLKEDTTAEKMTREMGNVEGASDVVLIAAKSDIDY
ncbi:DUF4956 domain-containing protein [uncultured Desulfuromonas sp.]|uniref:DUF4956 domain-containing protein n=1 Tax=uncultured Desulfuromonas sp. TaxID=181013 RepID=UPI002AAC4A89|nr:DUF4956 domain-containing protein [uncultured Desulfuromonas sp.]